MLCSKTLEDVCVHDPSTTESHSVREWGLCDSCIGRDHVSYQFILSTSANDVQCDGYLIAYEATKREHPTGLLETVVCETTQQVTAPVIQSRWLKFDLQNPHKGIKRESTLWTCSLTSTFMYLYMHVCACTHTSCKYTSTHTNNE